MAQYFVLGAILLIHLQVIASQRGNSNNETPRLQCDRPACENYTLSDSFRRVWLPPSAGVPQSTAIKGLRKAILQEYEDATDETVKTQLIMASFWATQSSSPLQSADVPDISCVFNELKIVDRTLDDPCRDRARFETAFNNYFNLGSSTVQNMKNNALINAGCPVSEPSAASFSAPVECPIDESGLTADINNSAYSDELKEALLNLLQSDERSDKLLVLLILSSNTRTSTTIIGEYQRADILPYVFRNIACKVKLPPKCCASFESSLDERFDSIGTQRGQFFAQVLANLNA